MGLDMYLTRRTYVGTEKVGYWRKANAIHSWFVRVVQDGEDECNEHKVSVEQLQELRNECQHALDTRETNRLQPLAGFLFGSTEIDEGYWQDLQDTIKIIDDLKMDESDYTVTYHYRSSW